MPWKPAVLCPLNVCLIGDNIGRKFREGYVNSILLYFREPCVNSRVQVVREMVRVYLAHQHLVEPTNPMALSMTCSITYCFVFF